MVDEIAPPVNGPPPRASTDPQAQSSARQRLWRAVLAVAKAVGHVQAWLLLTLLYVLCLAPVALIFKCLADPLRLRAGAPAWRTPPPPADRGRWARRQA